MITTDELIKILSRACGYDGEITPDTELINSGLLDSLALIRLADELDEIGIELVLTRVSWEDLRTPNKIMELIAKSR